MKTQSDPGPGSEDELRAENEVLKLKLEIEHGMNGFGSVLNPEQENQWLKSVYEFENLLIEAKDITLHELIGRPPLKRWYTLKPEKVQRELQKILGLLEKNGITLQRLRDYDEITFYRAITEELLPMKFGEFQKGPLFPPVIAWGKKPGS